jgi:hypothetical protein
MSLWTSSQMERRALTGARGRSDESHREKFHTVDGFSQERREPGNSPMQTCREAIKPADFPSCAHLPYAARVVIA